jgi:TolB-like protein/Flp pilus assembly protein TadD
LPGPDIFISYNREDAAVAKLYAEAFARDGLEVWWDQTLRSGETYDEVTEAALRGAKAVVVLWSPRSVDSRWVRAEASIADENGTLVPAKIEACQLPVMFRLTQTADLSNWRGATDDLAWLDFLDDIRRVSGSRENGRVETNHPADMAGLESNNGAPDVAILPFTYRGNDADIETLAEDLTQDVTREVANSSFLRVIAAGRMGSWRGRGLDPAALAREFGAKYVIEGKLHRANEQVHLGLQVIDGINGRMLKSARFSADLADVTASPESFPMEIGTEMCVQLEQIEMKRAMGKSGPLSGWDHLLRSMAYQSSGGTESYRRGLEEARLAVALTPDLGLAHAILAAMLGAGVGVLGQEWTEELSQEAQFHARRALQLDPDDPQIICWLGEYYTSLADGEAALRLGRRAVALYPTSPKSYFSVGGACLVLGQTKEAIDALTHQDSLTPNDNTRPMSLSCLGMAYFLEGRSTEAGAPIERALGLRPDLGMALKWKAIVAADLGNESEAIATFQRVREVEPDITLEQHVWQLEQFQNIAGRKAEAIAILRRLWQMTSGKTSSP